MLKAPISFKSSHDNNSLPLFFLYKNQRYGKLFSEIKNLAFLLGAILTNVRCLSFFYVFKDEIFSFV